MTPPPVSVGVSLKMYFGHQEARDWFSRVADIVRAPSSAGDAIRNGDVEFFVIPGYLAIESALEVFDGTRVLVGAQDVATADSGAFTGEVSGTELAEIGVRLAEVGHAERRRLYGETELVVAEKTAAALRNGLAPLLCVGEPEPTGVEHAIRHCVEQVRTALDGSSDGRIIVAYEPTWAIGAESSAPPEHVREVVRGLRTAMRSLPGREGTSIIYGGSAGPGTLSTLVPEIDGLFLGRFAHDPRAVAAVLEEASRLAAPGARRESDG